MHPRIAGLLRACLLALVAMAAAIHGPGEAAAQCTEEPCGPVDEIEPVITISPATGTFAAGARTVTINWSDNYALNHNSRVITYGTDNVTSAFSYTWTNGSLAQSTGQVTIGAGSKTLTAYICDASAYGPNCRTASVTYTGPTPAVRMTAETAPLAVPAMSWATSRYRVVNTGTLQTQYALTASCTSGYSCSASRDTVTLAPGDSAWVDANFSTTSIGGSVSLTAVAGSVTSTATTAVSALVQPDPGYPGDARSLERIERSVCVTVSLAPGVAWECGDLRVVHPLPSVRVLNQARTPVLSYNSDHARPLPVVAAQFAGPSGAVPDRIRGTLKVNGTVVADTVWPGWGASQTRRIALSFDAGSYRAGLYPYELVVRAEWLNGTVQTLPASRSGRMIIVNRSVSPFGAGWWLSGVERLMLDSIPGDTLKLWVGGDGSARLYRGGAGGPWRAEAYDRPDSLYRPAGSTDYIRTLPGGAKVRFDATGNHVATETSTGHVTRFSWRSVGTPAERRLDTLSLPSPSGQPDVMRYLFDYGTLGPGCTTATTGLTRVRSPAPDGGYRDSWLCGDVLRRVTRIRDATPDTTSVRFDYHSNTRWMIRRTDREQGVLGFSYIRVRLHTIDRTFLPGTVATTRIQAVQTLGMYGTSVRADSVTVSMDGPVPGALICDCTWWTVDRLGAPMSLRNVYGHLTTVRRGDSRWPGLVTETVAPNGFKTTAAFDTRGFPVSSTAWNPYGDNRHSTTTFRWNTQWSAPETVVSPEGEISLTGYDGHGRREWQQVGPSATRRVQFVYHPNTHASAPGLLERIVYPGGSADRVEYDARGNLSATVSPMGARSEFETDRLGRVTVQRVAIDTAGGIIRFQGDSTTYDSRGRVERSASFAPSLRGEGLQRAVVVNGYDRESRLTSASRTSLPDPELIGTVTTRWRYDLGGRRILEIAPDNTPADSLDNPRDSTVYDISGNSVTVFTRRYTDANERVVVEMRYDWLNRLKERIIPEIRYDSIEDGLALRGFIYPHENTRIQTAIPNRTRALPYPWYPNTTDWGYRIPGDQATFEYDAMGNLVRADNRDAWIRLHIRIHSGCVRGASGVMLCSGCVPTRTNGMPRCRAVSAGVTKTEVASHMFHGPIGTPWEG